MADVGISHFCMRLQVNTQPRILLIVGALPMGLMWPQHKTDH
jgi:hypothetical protein